MRKLSTLFIITLVFFILAGCADKPHEHTFGDKWEFDDTNHWHAATCEHKDEKSGLSGHEITKETTKVPSETEEGEEVSSCNVCGYRKVIKLDKLTHTHVYEEKWTTDSTSHWLKATCGHDEISGEAEHEFINTSDCTKTESVYKCSVCGYEKTAAERGRHNFGEYDVCTVCGGYRCGDNVAAIFDSTENTLTLRGTGDMFGYKDSDVRKWADLNFDALIVEDGVTSIGKESFKSLDFKSVKIGKDVKKIGSYAFAYTKKTETIEFDVYSTLDEIGSYAFQESGLKSVTLPSSLRILGTSSFNQCKNLSSFFLNEGIRQIKSNAIYNTAITELNLPSSFNPAQIDTSTRHISFWTNSKLTKLTVAEGNPYVKAVDGVLYSINGDKLIGVPAGKTEVTILNSVKTIGREAFHYWTGSKVTLPDSVTTIEKQAFDTSSYLASVKMGSKVETIDSSAFDYTPWNADKLTITINREANSIEGYENYWRTFGSNYKPIEIVWTGTSGS